ncbi:amidophosphoribosyltransferase [Sporobacter termitidis DSM 10068]|uniref:Amidophosphoribosyltransferase n=1 Tax=Sporobacter termitidis DSM 10068 TaxID=1123282 RepID=A0A1M5TTK0_9FIRM|nr:amidophosphoribosyltransferase [Sporobacter termitidis]SHH53906.1 amidophosphoribosyltransferase [Sporobacter termitidis DSM 10068]
MAIHEECGVFGIYDAAGNCAKSTYYGLYALQHRGQEQCGIAAVNNLELTCYKDSGLVGDVFSERVLNDLNGTMAIGHVRYSTTGGSRRENAQPLTLKYVKGSLAVAHNGNLVNTEDLKREYEYKGAIFHTTTDSEVIAYIIAQERLHSGSVEQAVKRAMSHLYGAYSLVVMSSRKLIAARDPWGFRPLCIGRRGDAIVFASESCALDSVGATFVRDVEPGEVVYVQNGELKSLKDSFGNQSNLCIFEYIYFARPDSIIDGQSVHDSRMLAGACLAEEYPVDADVVIGVPDSGLVAAKGYALASGIPFNDGFVKNRYVGRTFIKPDQASREMAVRLKLNPLRATVNGKRVVMIDDSVVRGTTSGQIIRLLREAGATEVHMLSSAPKFISPCYFGTDIPSRKELFACNHTTEEMRQIIGADSLGFLSVESLHKIAPNAKCGFCDACFTENYPIAVVDDDEGKCCG